VTQLPWLSRLLQRDGWLHVPAEIVATGGIGYELTRTLLADEEQGDLSLRALRIADAPIGVICVVHPAGASAAARAQQQRSADRAVDAAGPAIERASRLRSLGVKAGWWSAVLQELPYGVAVINRGTRLVSVNPAAEAAMSITQDQVVGKRLCERPISCTCPLHVTLRTGTSRQVPLSVIWPFPLPQAAAGQLVNIWATASSSNESEMVVIAISATSGRDPAPGIGTEVAAMISHELRAPLATLRASSELALEEFDDPERQRGLLSTISRQVDRLDHLVQELADVFRLQAGKLQLNREVLDLPELCHELVEELNGVGAHHRIVVSADESTGTVAADRLKIRTVLSNLVGNAAKYAPHHTQITLEIKDAGDGLEVSVQDEGAGIAAEDVPYIFEQFYRSKSVASTTKGYGLGLYITRALVELHGGQIRVENGSERGCRFTFVLPRRLDRLPVPLNQVG
jgi:signal transduction histidine kinase